MESAQKNETSILAEFQELTQKKCHLHHKNSEFICLQPDCLSEVFCADCQDLHDPTHTFRPISKALLPNILSEVKAYLDKKDALIQESQDAQAFNKIDEIYDKLQLDLTKVLKNSRENAKRTVAGLHDVVELAKAKEEAESQQSKSFSSRSQYVQILSGLEEGLAKAKRTEENAKGLTPDENNTLIENLIKSSQGLITRVQETLVFKYQTEVRALLLGLDSVGKTSLLYKWKLGEVVTCIPTIGFNVETIDYKGLQLVTWDIGGGPKLRALWKHYYQNTGVVLFVVDSTDRERISEEKELLDAVLADDQLTESVLVVLVNKIDLPGGMSLDEVAMKLELSKQKGKWGIFGVSARQGTGLDDVLDWIRIHTKKL